MNQSEGRSRSTYIIGAIALILVCLPVITFEALPTRFLWGLLVGSLLGLVIRGLSGRATQ